MTTETLIGVVGIGITQVAIVVKLLITDMRKANHSHVATIEKAQDLQREELQKASVELKVVKDELKLCQARAEQCERDRIRLEARINLLENRLNHRKK